MATFTGTSGTDTLNGTADADVFNFTVANLTADDTITGGNGADVLRFTTAGVISAAKLAHVFQIEAITLTVGGSTVILDDVFASHNGPVLQINATSGNDAVDAQGVTNPNFALSVFASDGNDLYRGGAGADVFRFGASQLTAADQVIGGNGAANDTLIINTAGAIAAGAFTQVRGIEQLTLSLGGISAALDDRFPASGTLVVNASSGNDVVDASAVADPAHAIAVFATNGGGTDVFRGGAGADSFRFAAGQLTGADTVQGNGGIDTLILNGGGTISAAELANVSGIEAITLGSAGQSLILTNGVAAANAAKFQVNTGAGNDVVDASAVTLAGWSLSTFSSGGRDTLRGGIGNDVFRFNASDLDYNDIVSGGGGYDTLIMSGVGQVSEQGFNQISNIDAVILGVSGITLNFNTFFIGQNPGLKFYGSSGNDVINAGSSVDATYGIDVTPGSGNDTVIGSPGGDIFRVAPAELTTQDFFNGGGGNDTLIFTSPGTVVNTLSSNLAGIDTIVLGVAGITIDVRQQQTPTILPQIIGSAGNDVIDATGNAVAISFVAGSGADTVHGGTRADTVSFTAADLTASDIVSGGENVSATQLDTLIFQTGGTIAASVFAHVTGFETINLSNAGNNLTLTDALVASAQADKMTVYGGALADTIDGTAVAAGHGVTVFGGNGNDIATLGSGDDYTDGQAGADSVSAGGGNDAVVYDPNDLSLAGGAGNDTLIVRNVGGTFNLSLADQTAGDVANVSGFENLGAYGTDASIHRDIYGSSAKQTIKGDIASEDIDGGGGADTISGGWAPGPNSGTLIAGDDRIAYHGTETAIYGFGADYPVGGRGSFANQTLVLLAPVTVDINQTADQTIGDATLVRQFVNVDASAVSAGVTIIGGQVSGSGQTQSIIGGGGNDTLSGATGSIVGNGGDDVLTGYASLTGPYSGATLTGGAGHDTFATQRDNNPVVSDFSSTDDTIQWHTTGSDVTYNGAAFDTVVVDTTGHANIASADLIRYGAGALDTSAQVTQYLYNNGSLPQTDSGVFVLAQNTRGDIVLWHGSTVDGVHTDTAAVFQHIGLNDIQLSDFSFV